MKRKRIMITGGAGFIGQHLCNRLLDEGHTVWSYDNLKSSSRDTMDRLAEAYPGQFCFTRGCIWKGWTGRMGPDAMKFLGVPFTSVDEIYHLACPASPPIYQKDPVDTMMTSVLGTKKVLDFAYSQGARVVFTSTSEVYGDPTVVSQGENYRGNVNCVGPRACYDEGKRAAEALCFDYQRQFGVDVRVARLFNTYGPGLKENDGRVVSNFMIQALKNKPLTVYGDGEQTRSFCYIDDTVDGLVKLMRHAEFAGPVNIGNPHEITINQLVKHIEGLVDIDILIENHDLPKDDPVRRCPDINLAQKSLGWSPKVDLETGLKETLKYFKDTLSDG